MGTLEDDTRKLIALNLLTSVSGSFGDRTKRRFEHVREELGRKLKEGTSLPESSELVLKLGWSDEAVKGARKTELAIMEFEQKYPEWGEKLREIINKHRAVRRAYLQFGGVAEEEVYIGIIREVMNGLDYDRAKAVYDTTNLIAGILKKGDSLQKSLLSE